MLASSASDARVAISGSSPFTSPMVCATGAYAIGDDRFLFFQPLPSKGHLLRVSKMDDQAVNSGIDQILDVLIVLHLPGHPRCHQASPASSIIFCRKAYDVAVVVIGNPWLRCLPWPPSFSLFVILPSSLFPSSPACSLPFSCVFSSTAHPVRVPASSDRGHQKGTPLFAFHFPPCILMVSLYNNIE